VLSSTTAAAELRTGVGIYVYVEKHSEIVYFYSNTKLWALQEQQEHPEDDAAAEIMMLKLQPDTFNLSGQYVELENAPQADDACSKITALHNERTTLYRIRRNKLAEIEYIIRSRRGTSAQV
jgi:hypothetical protein